MTKDFSNGGSPQIADNDCNIHRFSSFPNKNFELKNISFMERLLLNEKIKMELNLSSDPKYQKFSNRLLPGTKNILGVRMPKLHSLAKTLYKEHNLAALIFLSDDSFEEKMLQAFVIGEASLSIDDHLDLIQQIIPKLDNWSIVDSFVISLKVARRYPNEIYQFILPLLHDTHEFTVRFAVVTILTYFITKESKPSRFHEILDLLGKVKHPGYYAKMAVAWALSVCFSISSHETIIFLKKNFLDKTTYNKTIQKILESRRVSHEEKEKAKKLKKL